MSALPLAGIRVTDFTWIGAGSYTTKLLADFGADIIKIETSTRLDTLRETAPFRDGKPGVNRSGYFADRNASKRSITLNLKHPDAVKLAHKLVAQSDIVANNFTPGTMEKLGLGYQDVLAVRPDIIYLAMSMQGSTGPDANYVGFGLTIGALTGLQHLAGPVDRPPVGTGTNYPDHVPNPCHAAFALLAALYHRKKTGQGQLIDFAQTEPTIALLGPAIIDYTANGRIAQRRGNDDENAILHGVYPCSGKDRWIAVSVHSPQQWRAFIELLGPIPGGRNWNDAAVRREYRSEFEQAICEVTRNRDARDIMRVFQGRGVAAGMVQNARDLIDQDPQFAHRGHWVRLQHPEMGRSVYNAPPMRFSETPAQLRRPAPLLGQHTREICRDLLAVGDEDFARLEAEGVFK